MAKQKKIPWQLICDQREEPWEILRKYVDEHHPHLKDATFAMAWRSALKADKDGIIMLGKAKKASDLDRDLAAYDLLIILNREHWEIFDRAQREALIDHELCHLRVAKDKEGELRTDERGRPVYRMRKHDVEEFTEVIDRHGVYKNDLERFAESIIQSKKTPLFPPEVFDSLEEQPANGEAKDARPASARPRSRRRTKTA